jgi:flavin-dependent thymidylate synthase
MSNVTLGVNTVELLGTYGGDETHALSAWTSTKRELTDEKRSRMESLLKMLAENGHHTPFEKSYLHFLVTCDVASHIHLIKHRIGVSVNAESARYKELNEDKFYIPQDWPPDLQEAFRHRISTMYAAYHETLKELTSRNVSRKRAKESSRFYLPYANQIVSDISFNFRSFMHFQSLRNKPEAQLEIQQIAKNMLQLVWSTGNFDLSLKGFGYVLDMNGDQVHNANCPAFPAVEKEDPVTVEKEDPVTVEKEDPVNHPSHYKMGGIETIDFIRAKGLSYNCGNAVKYITRSGHKPTADPIEDLKKAVFYLNDEIKHMEKKRG